MEDPLLEGALLIDQHQAQIVSALRCVYMWIFIFIFIFVWLCLYVNVSSCLCGCGCVLCFTVYEHHYLLHPSHLYTSPPSPTQLTPPTSPHSVSLGKDASPPLMAQGAALAAMFLEHGMASGDPAILERLLGLLLTPLLTPNTEAHSYAEWVVVRGTVALLEANAHCCVFAATRGDAKSAGVIAAAHQPHDEYERGGVEGRSCGVCVCGGEELLCVCVCMYMEHK